MEENLFRQILDDSNQMIQVSDTSSFSVLYANAPARNFAGHEDHPFEGEYCYKYMMGLDEQCPFCPLRTKGDKSSFETQVNNGSQVLAVKIKPTEWNGKKAFI